MSYTLRISEVFGPTVQGEGFACGRHCLFVRLYDCNLACNFCDTAYTWANTEARANKHRSLTVYPKETNRVDMTVDEVLKALSYFWDWQRYPTIIVMSGGEPLMQTLPLSRLARKLEAAGCAVHIETAGTIIPSAELDLYVDQYNVSPKLSNSGNPERKRNKPKVMTWFRNCDRAFFKFVVTELSDLDEVDSIVHNYCLPRFRVQIMPEGQTAEQNIKVAKEVAEEAVRRGYGISFRTHVLLWGDERGH